MDHIHPKTPTLEYNYITDGIYIGTNQCCVMGLAEVLKKEGAFGYNAGEDKFEDLVQAGIVDPTKVSRSALQNAASAAGMFLTTEAVVTDIPSKDDHNHNPGMGGMGGMGMGDY